MNKLSPLQKEIWRVINESKDKGTSEKDLCTLTNEDFFNRITTKKPAAPGYIGKILKSLEQKTMIKLEHEYSVGRRGISRTITIICSNDI